MLCLDTLHAAPYKPMKRPDVEYRVALQLLPDEARQRVRVENVVMSMS
jgi:hypothetical protein